MISQWIQRCRGLERNLVLFLAGMALLGVSGGMMETTFNNYVSDTFNLGADARGLLEFPRELPGFLTALFAGLLFFLPETRIAGFSALAIGAGMLGLAWIGPHWSAMLAFLTLWSTGAHLMMPVRSSVTMELAASHERGRRMGQIASTAIAASIVGCALVWVTMRWLHASYRLIFILGGLASFMAAFFLFAMRLPNAHLQRPKFIWRGRYWLYYVLSFLFGARKQVFITFGPWVLIRVFHQPVWIFAQLWIAAAVLGVFFQPALGRAIDRFGERAVLLVDSALILLVCLGYGFAHLLPNPTAALGLLYACFVADNLLFGVNMARDTYLSKIVQQPDHLAPTLSLGITINHAVSMSIPAAGGLLWMRYGHSSVFLATACIAVLMGVFSAMVKLPKPAWPADAACLGEK
jgi:MFS family permease